MCRSIPDQRVPAGPAAITEAAAMSIRQFLITLICAIGLAGCASAGPLAVEAERDETLELLELAEMVDREGAAAVAKR